MPQEQIPDLRGTAVADESRAEPSSAKPGQDLAGQPLPDYGPNNENLPQALKAALWGILSEVAREGILARRFEVQLVRKARLFWKGQQYVWWSSVKGDYQFSVTAAGLPGTNEGLDDQPRRMYVTNIFTPFGKAIISALSQRVPPVPLAPESASSEQDITTAKAGSKVIEYLERINDAKKLLSETAYYCYTDGKIGGYVRYVVDGQKFGYSEEPIFELRDMQMPDMIRCAVCGFEEPLEDARAAAGGQNEGNCPQCNAPLSAENVVPGGTVQVPQQTGVRKIPNGQEVITIVGALELKTPIWADSQSEYPYLLWNREVHESKLKAAYPHVADKIHASAASGGTEEEIERISRLQTTQSGHGETETFNTGAELQHLVTFSRGWLRPWTFFALEDKSLRDQLLSLFPDGAYVGFAGETYCESRNESMDDRWRVMHPLPGDGQHKPSLGEHIISVQERLNDLANITMEMYEYGIPSTFVDSEIIDIEALEEQTAEPGAMYPVQPRPGQPVAGGFFTTPALSVGADMLKHMGDLFGTVPQFITGALPAMYGGEMETQKTATAYAQAKQQAMGVMGLPWGRIQRFYQELMLLGLECFRQNRQKNVEMSVLADSGEWRAEVIDLADLKGKVHVYPEPDESLPTSPTERKATLMQLMQTLGDTPEGVAFLTDPANLEQMRDDLGLEDYQLPGTASRIKQLREIDGMVEQGQPVEPHWWDDHGAELATCLAWMRSEKGMETAEQNPQGFAGVEAHAQMHQAAIAPAPVPALPIGGARAGVPAPLGNPPPAQ